MSQSINRLLPLALILLLAGCSTSVGGASSAPPVASGSAASTGAGVPSASSSAEAASPSASSSASGSASASGAGLSSSASPSAELQTTSSTTQPSCAPNCTSQEEQLAIAAYNAVGPAIVKITHPLQGGQALGSGTIIDSRGYILTNNHVAEGTTTYQVTLADNRTVQGTLVGSDPLDDLAVIQIHVANLPVVQMGNSSELRVAQTVLAIGNPIGFSRTVTEGVVSALDRTVTEPTSQVTGQGGSTIPNMIQTSAPINPGNSGGALIDLNGRLVGVPTLAATDPEMGGTPALGIAFAVPVNTAKLVVPQIIATGKVTHSGRAFLGVGGIQTVDPQLARAYNLSVNQGAFVAQVVSGGPAAKAGMKQGDIITGFNGQPIDSASSLEDAILSQKPGDPVKVTVSSGGKQQTLNVTLGEAPVNG